MPRGGVQVLWRAFRGRDRRSPAGLARNGHARLEDGQGISPSGAYGWSFGVTPERYGELDDLWHRALEKPAAERQAFVDTVCAGDEALRRELESLLASFEQAEGFLEQPPDDVAAEMFQVREEAEATRTLAHYEHLRGDIVWRLLEKTFRLFERGKQRFQLAAQRLIARADGVDKGLALRRRFLQGPMPKVLEFPVAFRRHPEAPSVSARWRNALAIFQSRMTVSGETCRASAVSSTESPPKYLHSTTRHCRACSNLSLARASSSAMSSAARSTVTPSSERRGSPPPLFLACRARA